MNKKIAFFIVFLILVLIGILVFLYFLSSRSSETPFDSASVVPTQTPLNGTSTPKKTVTSAFNVPSAEEVTLINEAQQSLPFESNDLKVDYSELLDTFYIQNTATDSAQLNAFLSDNNLLDLFRSNPSLFKFTQKLPRLAIDEDEQLYLEEQSEGDYEKNLSTTTDEKQLEALNGLFNLMFDLTIPTPEPTTPEVATDQPTQPDQSTPPDLSFASDTSNIPCAAGQDLGTADGYRNGQRSKIRICRVQNFTVNSQLSKQVNDMFNAARTAGLSFYASGASGAFRTMTGQISVYQRWCKARGITGSAAPYPKAPGQTIRCPGGGAPGYSNHQMGFALDLGCNGKLIPQRYKDALKNSCFQWLQANAGRYGLKEVGLGKDSSRASGGYEGWHWSIDGR